ncbi:MAG: hypothetical protein Q7T03_02110, partial [Deltaproteobacteria bacterium]|nr:hypothetical protein [Deltaproteobacteria bacterium]
MNTQHSPRLFTKIFLLFLSMGVSPILLIAFVFSLPFHLEFIQYKNLIGVLLILSTVSTLCLSGLVTRLLKEPLNKLLEAQKEIRHGHLDCRLSEGEGQEFEQLFDCFNKMAYGMEMAAKHERMVAEERVLFKT